MNLGSNLWSHVFVKKVPQERPTAHDNQSQRNYYINVITKTKNWTLLFLNSRHSGHCIILNEMLPKIRNTLSQFYPCLKIKQIWYVDDSGTTIEKGQEDISKFIPNGFKVPWFPWIILVSNNWSSRTEFMNNSFSYNYEITKDEHRYKQLYPCTPNGFTEFVRVSLCL